MQKPTALLFTSKEQISKVAILIYSRDEFDKVVPHLISEGYRFLRTPHSFYEEYKKCYLTGGRRIETTPMIIYLNHNWVSYSDRRYYMQEYLGVFKLISSKQYLSDKIPKKKTKGLPKRIQERGNLL